MSRQTDDVCLHCAIWRAIKAQAGELDADAVLNGMAQVIAEVIATAPSQAERRISALGFGARVGAFVDRLEAREAAPAVVLQ